MPLMADKQVSHVTVKSETVCHSKALFIPRRAQWVGGAGGQPTQHIVHLYYAWAGVLQTQF